MEYASVIDFFGTTPSFSAEEERVLIEKAQQGDSAAAAALIKSNILFIKSIASRYHCSNLTLDDLISAGVTGLAAGIQDFDLNCHNKLITYAQFKIINAIKAMIRGEEYTITPSTTRKVSDKTREKWGRVTAYLDAPVGNEENSCSFGETISAGQDYDPEFIYLQDELHHALEDAFTVLNDDEAFILRSVTGYGMDECLSYRQIAAITGDTHSGVAYKLRKACRKIQDSVYGCQLAAYMAA